MTPLPPVFDPSAAIAAWAFLCLIWVCFKLYHYIHWNIARKYNPDALPKHFRTMDQDFFSLAVRGTIFLALATAVLAYYNNSIADGILVFSLCVVVFYSAIFIVRSLQKHYPIFIPDPPPLPSPAPPQPGEISETARKIIDELSKRP